MKKRRHVINSLLLLGTICFINVNCNYSKAEVYEYDKLNRVTRIIYDDGSVTRYIYDKNGNLKNVISEPKETKTPSVTEVPVITEAPVATKIPVITEVPVATETPKVTDKPNDFDNEESIVDIIIDGITDFFEDIKDFFKKLF